MIVLYLSCPTHAFVLDYTIFLILRFLFIFSSSSRNLSMLSLQEMDIGSGGVSGSTQSSHPTYASSMDLTSTGIQRIPTIPNIRKPKPVTTGRPEYMGICLPVDVTMLFHVSRGRMFG